jgi:hypothetical protein
MTHPDSHSNRPTLRATVSSVREWLRLLARYAWTRPSVYRVVGVLVVTYTMVVAVDDETAMWRWLIGLVLGLFGWGLTRTARRLTASDLEQDRRRGAADLHLWLFDQLFARLPLPVARGTEFIMGAILIFAGLALAMGSVFAL